MFQEEGDGIMNSTKTGYGVKLRPLEYGDIPKLWEIVTLETFQHFLNKYETYEQFYQSLTKKIETTSEYIFAVVDEKTDEIAGSTSIYMIDEINKSCEIGGTFYGTKFQRTHVNTATKLLLLEELFDSEQYIRVMLRTDENNIRSQQAIERLGAKKEGVLRNERIRSNGEVRNAVLYSIVPTEWIDVRSNLVNKLNKYSK